MSWKHFLTRIVLIPGIILSGLPSTLTVKASEEGSIDLPVLKDIFVSPSTQNGNRRMLFVGTYTDTTVCNPEGCPPIYENAKSLIAFDFSRLPSNTIPVRAELVLYHYGSNADLSMTISRILSPWNDHSPTLPQFEGNYGTAVVQTHNTQNSLEIKRITIQINAALIPQLYAQNNGLLLRPSPEDGAPGVVFCSSNSDGFCQPQHSPKLHITYVPNNAPSTPQIIKPGSNDVISGNCDESSEEPTGVCRDALNVNFSLDSITDSDPYPGNLKSTVIQIYQNGEPVKNSGPLTGNPAVSWDTALADGVYTWHTYTTDGLGMNSPTTTDRTLSVDSTPPQPPNIEQLPQSYDIANTALKLKASMQAEYPEIDPVKYRISFSNDPDFKEGVTVTEWQDSPEITIPTSTLKPGNSYYFKAGIKDSAGNISSWSQQTSTTMIDAATLSIPTIDKHGWGILDGILADGKLPELSRLTNGYVLRSREITIKGKSEKDRNVELFVNNARIGSVSPTQCTDQCDYSFVYRFPATGANNGAGIPLQRYEIQVRAVSRTGRTSPLSAKEVIYYDTQAPTVPKVNLTSNNVSLISSPLTNGSEAIVDINAERYSDMLYTLTNPQGKIIERRLWRSPFNQSSRIRSILPVDGTYTITLSSTDAAGNQSPVFKQTFTRDTTPPLKPIVDPYICDSNICLKVSGELNSVVIVDDNDRGVLASQPQILTASEKYTNGKRYIFNVRLRDAAGNISELCNVTLTPPSSGLGDIPGSTLDYPYAYFSEFNQTNIDMDVIVDPQTGSYRIDTFRIPGPALTFHERPNSNDLWLYGISMAKGHKVNAKILNEYLSYDEAELSCDRGWFKGKDRECMEKLMGIHSLSQWEKQLDDQCGKWFWSNAGCKNEKKSRKNLVQKGIHEVSVPHIKLSIFKDDGSYLSEFWMDHKSAFKHYLPTNGKLQTGDEVKAKATLYGDFDFDGIRIDYRGKTSDFGSKLAIEEPKIVFNDPVGFPLRNFRLNNRYEQYFTKSGSDTICKRINCTADGKGYGDFVISRGANMSGHGPADIDFAPTQYSASAPIPVVATSDGILIIDSDSYKYGYPRLTHSGEYKCTGQDQYNDIRAQIIARNGMIIEYAHLSPLTYKLEIWEKSGQKIKRGDVIGFIGTTGCSTGPHLHYNFGHDTTSFYKSFSHPLGIIHLPEELPGLFNKENVDSYVKRVISGDIKNIQFNF